MQNKKGSIGKIILAGTAIVLGIFLLLIMWSSQADDTGNVIQEANNKNITQDTAPQEVVVVDKEVDVVEQPEKVLTLVENIEKTIKDINGDLEVTIWDDKSKFADDTTEPPYEIIVNAGKELINNCKAAKFTSFDIMKKIYGDEQTRDKISRIIFTSAGHLKLSIGANNGTQIDWNPAATGPTLFWETMIDTTGEEDEDGPLSERSWGKYLNSDCK